MFLSLNKLIKYDEQSKLLYAKLINIDYLNTNIIDLDLITAPHISEGAGPDWLSPALLRFLEPYIYGDHSSFSICV